MTSQEMQNFQGAGEHVASTAAAAAASTQPVIFISPRFPEQPHSRCA